MMNQSDTLSMGQITFITLFFFQVHSAAGTFTSHRKLYNYAEPKRHILMFLHPIFAVEDHILNIVGDALLIHLLGLITITSLMSF